MKLTKWTIKSLSIALLLAISAACSPIDRTHGYVPDENSLEKLVVGVSDRQAVLEHAGSPITKNERYGETWFYVNSRFRQQGYRAIEEVDRQVVAISFDDEGSVSNIERYALHDGRPVAISRRVTESNIGRLTFIEQMLRGLGRIDPTRALSRN